MAAGEHHAIPRKVPFELAQKLFPLLHGFRPGHGDLVQGIQEQGQAPLPQQDIEPWQLGVACGPLRREPVLRRRQGGIGTGRFVVRRGTRKTSQVPG